MKEPVSASYSNLERDLQKLNRMLQAAHRSSIDIRNSYDFYVLAVKEFNKENFDDAYLYYDRSKYELTNTINETKFDLKGLRVHSLRTISYFFKIYGLYAEIFGILSALFFSFLIYRYPEVVILGVPLWASFIAGLGASIQILTGVVDDLRREGQVIRYKRVWYTAIPLLGFIIGYMTYLLFNSGIIAFNVNSQSEASSSMIICFLAGFLTSWMINRLSRFSEM